MSSRQIIFPLLQMQTFASDRTGRIRPRNKARILSRVSKFLIPALLNNHLSSDIQLINYDLKDRGDEGKIIVNAKKST